MKQGFTLPDTLIGITLFLIVASSIYGLLNMTISMSSKAAHSFEATNIAREGIEIMEQIRSAHIIHHLPWNSTSTDTFWNSPNTFAQLSKDNPLCLQITPNSQDSTPWTITRLGSTCAEAPLGAITKIEAEKTLRTYSITSTGTQIPYGRTIQLRMVPADQYAIDTSKQTSSHTIRDDDIMEVTATAWWWERGYMRTYSLQKILTRWNTTL